MEKAMGVLAMTIGTKILRLAATIAVLAASQSDALAQRLGFDSAYIQNTYPYDQTTRVMSGRPTATPHTPSTLSRPDTVKSSNPFSDKALRACPLPKTWLL